MSIGWMWLKGYDSDGVLWENVAPRLEVSSKFCFRKLFLFSLFFIGSFSYRECIASSYSERYSFNNHSCVHLFGLLFCVSEIFGFLDRCFGKIWNVFRNSAPKRKTGPDLPQTFPGDIGIPLDVYSKFFEPIYPTLKKFFPRHNFMLFIYNILDIYSAINPSGNISGWLLYLDLILSQGKTVLFRLNDLPFNIIFFKYFYNKYSFITRLDNIIFI